MGGPIKGSDQAAGGGLGGDDISDAIAVQVPHGHNDTILIGGTKGRELPNQAGGCGIVNRHLGFGAGIRTHRDHTQTIERGCHPEGESAQTLLVVARPGRVGGNRIGHQCDTAAAGQFEITDFGIATGGGSHRNRLLGPHGYHLDRSVGGIRVRGPEKAGYILEGLPIEHLGVTASRLGAEDHIRNTIVVDIAHCQRGLTGKTAEPIEVCQG